eukprot:9063390-Pyramimonas_sp.AAC.1
MAQASDRSRFLLIVARHHYGNAHQQVQGDHGEAGCGPRRGAGEGAVAVRLQRAAGQGGAPPHDT